MEVNSCQSSRETPHQDTCIWNHVWVGDTLIKVEDQVCYTVVAYGSSSLVCAKRERKRRSAMRATIDAMNKMSWPSRS